MIQGKSYHRYFEGFSERKVWDDKKKRYRMERYYSGDYYQAQIPDEERKRLKQEYLAGYICAIFLFLIAATRRVPSNASLITVIPTLIILLCLVWQIMPLISYLRAQKLLIARQYREKNNFLNMNMGLTCAFLASALTHLCCIISYGNYEDTTQWLVIGALILDAALFFRFYCREKQVVYIKVANDVKIPADCYDIACREYGM